MKILAIHIKNLASLEGEHLIDFCAEPLQSAGIFAITGPTGSGKSTILDALCLALYEQAPRYKNAAKGNAVTDITGSALQQNDPRKILRDGAGEGYAKVDFVGMDGHEYQAAWVVRRARSRASGRLQKAEMQLTHLRSGQPVPGKKTEILAEIEKRVGLNFEQFTRSVLLAQGDFTAFLKAGKDEQSSLLEKLTGMQVYSEISKHIFERWREEEQQLREWKARGTGVPQLSEEELADLREHLQETERQLNKGKAEIKRLEEQLVWRRRLESMTQQAEQSHNEFDAARRQEKGVGEREQQLRQIMAAQPAGALLKNLQNAGRLYLEKQKFFREIEKNFLELESVQKQLAASITEGRHRLFAAEKKYEKTLPDLTAARILDTRLQDKADQLKRLEAQYEKEKDAAIAIRNRLEAERQQLQKLEDKKEDLQSWLEKNEERRPIAEQEQLILAKLNDAARNLHQISLKDLSGAEEQGSVKSFLEELKVKDEQLSKWVEAQKQDEAALQSLQEKLVNVDFQELTVAENRMEKEVSELTETAARWKILFHQLQEQKKLEKQITEVDCTLKEKYTQLAHHKEILPGLKAQKESAAELLRKAQLAVAENVESLRGSLTDGEACPVCGSKEHPYMQEESRLQLVFSELKKGFDGYEAKFNRCEIALQKLQQDCQTLKSQWDKWIQEFHDSEKNLQSELEAWQSFSFYKVCKAIPEGQRQSWLAGTLEKEKATLSRIRQQMAQYTSLKEESGRLVARVAERERRGHQLENERKDILRKLDQSKENGLRLQKEKVGLEEDLKEQRLAISRFLKADGWFDAWRENPDAFTGKIKAFAEKWREQNRQQDTIEEQLKKATIACNGWQEKYHSLQEQLKKQEENIAVYSAQRQEAMQDRACLLGGKPVAEEEANLKSCIQKARQALDNKLAEKEKADARFTRIETVKEQTQNDIQLRKQELTDAQCAIDKWLKDFNREQAHPFTFEMLETLLQKDSKWMEAERNSIQAIKDKILEAASVWKERQEALEKWQLDNKTEHNVDTLLEMHAKANRQLEAINKNFHELDYRIKEDAKNKNRMADILAAAEKQAGVVEKWSQLNEVVGSSDGKKFRQIAQEYTLEVLLSFANVHLKNLNPRYILQKIPDGLGLQVMDLDMGREVRTVFSLSGGESFLVSLALALGLASLSSNRMKVESLFIDEGFGSLDPDTLNIAMDALERLYNQGRKVGVISHVQEMTERIPVQIKVRKEQSGKSSLEVVAF